MLAGRRGEFDIIARYFAPLSKGEFHKALVRDRVKLANIDDLIFSRKASERLAGFKPLAS